MLNPIRFFIERQSAFIFGTSLTQKITLAALSTIWVLLTHVKNNAINKNHISKETFAPNYPIIDAIITTTYLLSSRRFETNTVTIDNNQTKKESDSPSYTALTAIILVTYLVASTALGTRVLHAEKDLGRCLGSYCSKHFNFLSFKKLV